MIRETELAERSRAVGQPWEDVRARFEAAGCKQTGVITGRFGTNYVYLLKPAAWVSESGVSHDLIVEVSVAKETDPRSANKQGTVTVVAAGLVSEPNMPYAQLRARRVYPEGSAFVRCAETPDFAAAVKRFPFIRRVEITYDRIRTLDEPPLYDGFKVEIELWKRAGDERAGAILFFTIACGLDPPRDWQDRVLPEFNGPRRTFDRVESWGANEWGPQVEERVNEERQ